MIQVARLSYCMRMCIYEIFDVHCLKLTVLTWTDQENSVMGVLTMFFRDQWDSGESHGFRTTSMADTSQTTVDSGKTFFIFPLILVRLAWGLKQIPQENESNMPILCDFRTSSG